MNQFPYDVNHAVANDKLSRYRAEADNARLAKLARVDQPGSLERLLQGVGTGVAAVVNSLKRPSSSRSLPTA